VEMPLRCQHELHTHVVSGVPANKNPEDSSQVSVKATRWVTIGVTENISHKSPRL
jgi:hypothetical protein